jgi:hypothetical protein
MASLLQNTKNAIVLYNYEPKEHDELKLVKGEQIIVLEEVTENDGWSLGQNQDGVKGIYPSNYVSIQSEDTPPTPKPKRTSIKKIPTVEQNGEVEEKTAISNSGINTSIVEPNVSDNSFVLVDSWDLGVPSQNYVLGQKIPIWKYPQFIDLIADPYVDGRRINDKTKLNLKNGSILDSISRSVKFLSKLCDVLCRSPHLEKSWKKIIWDVKNACSQTSLINNMIPRDIFSKSGEAHSNVANSETLRLIESITSSIDNLQVNHCLVLPGGWQNKDYDDVPLLYIIYRKSYEEYSFAICNTSINDDPKFHPMRLNPRTHKMERATPLILKHIPKTRISDASFWFMLYRPLFKVVPNPQKTIYEKLLPFLNSKPFMSNLSSYNEDEMMEYWSSFGRASDLSNIGCVFKAFLLVANYTDRPVELAKGNVTPYLKTLFLWAIVRMIQHDLETGITYLSTSDASLLRMACKCLSLQAGKEGILKNAIANAYDMEKIQYLNQVCNNKVDSIRVTLENEAPSELPDCADGDSWMACNPLFGKMRNDYTLDHLIGKSNRPPILHPVPLTIVDTKIDTFNDVSNVLRHTVDLCTLLAHQSRYISNTYCFRVSLIQQLFLEIIPLPIALTDKNRDEKCFWSSQQMRRETQNDLMRLLHLITRHYVASSLSLRMTRNFDALRILTMASIATITDAVMRIKACDIPSILSLHYSGDAEGPVARFGFNMNEFAIESENLEFSDPSMNIARTMVLDYFNGIDKSVSSNHRIFNFEKLTLSCGDQALLSQVCLATGFPLNSTVLPMYLSGENLELLDNFPELALFRDIVFLFHLMTQPSSDALPEVKRWKPVDAALSWKVKKNTNDKVVFTVMGFGRPLSWEPRESRNRSQSSVFSGFFGISRPRAPPSSADPKNIIGKNVETEDDILHVLELPTFNNTLNQRDSELLLTYLTAPYIRIPLVLNFFTKPGRIRALACIKIQAVVDACMFEPGLWQEEDIKPIATQIPSNSRKVFATPLGLIINELVHSPHIILESVEKILSDCLDLDTGKYTQSSSALLYVSRLAVRIEGYLKVAIRHNKWVKEKNKLSRANWAAHVRGFQCANNVISEMENVVKKLKTLLRSNVFRVLERWLKKALQAQDMITACIVHAHLIYIFKNTEPNEYDFTTVSVMVTSQVFLTSRYRYNVEAGLEEAGKGRARSKTFHVDNSLFISQTELFSIFQRHRRHIL